jgi:hypothetical protein
MVLEFENRVRECIPGEVLFLDIDTARQPRSMLELTDGRLLGVSPADRSISSDGGKTWSEPEPLFETEGGQMEGAVRHLLQLKSGRIGAFWSLDGADTETKDQYGYSVWFRKSDDNGKTWSRPVRVSEPYNNAVMHSEAALTASGRIVASVYNLVGKVARQKSRALFGDEIARVGAHGYEHFFTYCWAYYSDDEGETWHTNEGKGKWGAGGELFVTLDYSGGGHYRCNEPSVVEVSPEHLLMLLRTPLGRFYQSWSADNGTTWSHPEPSSLATALAPAALGRIPGTGDLLVIWNQSSADEIEKGLQRHRLSTAISKDGGATWLRGRNVFSVYGEGDRTYVEPPPIQNYRAMELAPRLPANDIQGTYPFLTFWKDTAIVRFHCLERSDRIVGTPETVGYELPDPQSRGVVGGVQLGLPISWFYEGLARFG